LHLPLRPSGLPGIIRGVRSLMLARAITGEYVMRNLLSGLLMGVLVAGCGLSSAEPAVPQEEIGSVQSAAREPCPFLPPICPDAPGCHLTQSCPHECKCPPNVTVCGSTVCRKNETCCSGQPFPEPTCIEGDICPISKREFKKEVEYLGPAALRRTHDQLLKYKLATWRYTSENDGAQRHLGFIIDDVGPDPSVASNGQRVDLYGYTSMAVATLQVQAQEIAALKAELAELKAELARLKHP
jgi:hypothetical protein